MFVYAAFLQKDTLKQTGNLNGLSRARNRLDKVRECVRAARAKVQTDVNDNKHRLGEYVTVFLAPEYYFSRDCGHHHRFVEQGEKQEIVRGLEALSLECPRTVLVPGTVPWWRKLYQNDHDDERRDKLRKRIQTSTTKMETVGRNLFGNPLPYPSQPGWGFATPSKKHALGLDMNPPCEKLNQLIGDRGRDAYVAQNTAYIAYGGKVLKYHKRGNFKELDGENEHRVVYAPGSQCGRFKVGPLRFGMEICLDHFLGMLSSEGPPVHVHMVVSASVDYKPAHTNLAQGGVFLHADSHHDDHVRTTGNATSTQIPVQGKLRLYKVTLDDGQLGIVRDPAMRLDKENLGESSPPPITLTQNR